MVTVPKNVSEIDYIVISSIAKSPGYYIYWYELFLLQSFIIFWNLTRSIS